MLILAAAACSSTKTPAATDPGAPGGVTSPGGAAGQSGDGPSRPDNAGTSPAEPGIAGDSGGGGGLPPIAVEPGTGDGSSGGGGAQGGGGSDSGGGGSGGVVTPENPGASDVTLAVDATRDRHPISPYIYGTNEPDWSGKTRFLTLARAGGNRWTAFNWENNASNAGSDYLFQNDDYLGRSNVPGETPRSLTAAAHAAGASMLMQIPICGYVAADKSPGGDVNQSANYLQTRFRRTVARKNGAFVYPPDTGDDAVYQDEFVGWLERQFPESRTDSSRTLFYALDNEPDLWSDTHARIHPNKATYAELVSKNVEFARAIKDVAPQALVFGSVNYGWQGFVDLQNAPDAAGRDYLEVYLDSMRQAEASAGRRLVDVLDLHWYPEATGGGTRILADDAGAAIAQARLQAPRSLWDPTYRETSWVANSVGGPLRLLPRIKEKIAAHYPGTRLAISEYSYGAGGSISGGLAQADALGVFGREGLFAATLWHLGSSDQAFAYAGFALYRNLDGQGAAFGDISVRADSSAVDQTTVYASVDSRSANRLVIVAINKAAAPRTAGVQITADRQFRSGQLYELTSAAAAPVRGPDLALAQRNAFQIALPAMSATAIVLSP